MSVTIVVADDEDLVRTGLVRLLSDIEDFSVLEQVTSGEEAYNAVKAHKPDIILIDLNMPGMGGIEAIRKIVALGTQSKVIAVTGMRDDLYVDRVLKLGASGFVTKASGFDEIVCAIRKVAKGQRYISQELAETLALKRLEPDYQNTPFDRLSEREMQTMLMIASGMKAPDIADSFNIAPKTVNSYRYRIFEKLNIETDVELVLLAIKHGLLQV